MLQTPTHYILLLTSIALFLWSCHKNDADRPSQSSTDTATVWKLQTDVNLDKKITQTLYATDSFLYVATTNYILKIDKSNKLVSSYQVSVLGNGLYDKPFLNSKYYGYISPDKKGVLVGLIDKPWINKEIRFGEFDTLPLAIQNNIYQTMSINDAGELLVPASSGLPGSTYPYQSVTDFFFFNLKSTSDSIQAKLDHIVKRTFVGALNFVTLFSYNNNFYYSTPNDTTTLISPVIGASFFIPYECCFQLNIADTSVFIGFNEQTNLGVYAATSTWSESMQFNYSFFGGSVFASISNKIIAAFENQIWLVSFDYVKGTIQVKELDTSGMQPADISSMTYFNGKVYIATFNGLYYKSVNHLLIFQ